MDELPQSVSLIEDFTGGQFYIFDYPADGQEVYFEKLLNAAQEALNLYPNLLSDWGESVAKRLLDEIPKALAVGRPLKKTKSSNKKSVSKAKVQKLIERDGQKCHYCNCDLVPSELYRPDGLSVDHVVPQALGGTNRLDNLVLACRRCNGEKYTKHYQEFRMPKEVDAAILFLIGEG